MALDGETVLIVEDEPIVALHIEDAIREAGADVVAIATTAHAAIAELERAKITLAVLDINLGTGTSLPVATRLAEEGIPFVFHTARPELTSAWPCAPFVSKPATAQELVAALDGAKTGH